ncbi:putative F-box protein At1g47790 [Cornus florida]|uniref:putative F-box protein At1g47790 n=1 Tax=Cornus florida TaxID=4283 RepID=UPI00289FF4B4|nr:putative F-box protein At1g47790 [Cornus florida]
MENAQPRMKKRKVNKGVFGVSVPREIIWEILKELPVKTLLRLGCVSRQWRSIIDDDPLFVESHHNRSITRPDGINLLFLTKRDWNWQLYSPDPKGGPALHLLSVPINLDGEFPLYSVNGLICFGNCIWNPSTKQRIAVPGARIRSPTIEMRGENLLMVKSLYLLGFDPSSGKHKVLNINQITSQDEGDEEAQTQFKVLTLSRGGASTTWREWRDIDVDSDTDDSTVAFMAANSYYSPGSGPPKTACCINGIIYCLGYTFPLKQHVILAFEVGPESFKIMPLPKGAKSISFFTVEVGGGRLALINHEVTKIWILEDYDKQLWNMHTLEVNGKRKRSPIPIGSTGGGDLLFHDFKSMFFYYDIESKRMRRKDYSDLKLQGNMASGSVFIKHVETLF